MALVRVLCVAALVIASPAHAETVADWRHIINEASSRFGVPASWIERIMQAESGGRTTLIGKPIRSRAGAIGLMQLMPATWDQMRRTLGLGMNPDDPRDNILAGTFYLRWLYQRFGYPGLFAAYNAGPARYADHLASGRALPGETTAYLAKISHAPQAAPARQPEPLFAIRRDAIAPPEKSLSPIFVVQK